jgi:hypothetical protein
MRTFLNYLLLALLLVAAWFMWAQHGLGVAAWWIGSTDGKAVENAAQWSDSFGAFNALVSALGFGAVLATLWFQAASLKEQARDQHRQRFETTFFELLRIMREMRSEIRFEHSSEYKEAQAGSRLLAAYSLHGVANNKLSDREVRFSGYEAIREAVKEIRFWLNSKKTPQVQSGLVAIYNKRIHHAHEPTISPYFRILYTILYRLQSDTTLSQTEKADFGNLLRSQLTSDEIMLMAVNGLAPVSKDFGTLITEFRMLKYLPKTSLRTELEAHYESCAFQPRD